MSLFASPVPRLLLGLALLSGCALADGRASSPSPLCAMPRGGEDHAAYCASMLDPAACEASRECLVRASITRDGETSCVPREAVDCDGAACDRDLAYDEGCVIRDEAPLLVEAPAQAPAAAGEDCTAMARGGLEHAAYCDAIVDPTTCAADPACLWQASLPQYGGSFCRAEPSGTAAVLPAECESPPSEPTPEPGQGPSSGQAPMPAPAPEPAPEPTPEPTPEPAPEPTPGPDLTACAMERGSAEHIAYCAAVEGAAECDADPACVFQSSIPLYGGSFCRAIDDGPDVVFDAACAGTPVVYRPDSHGDLVITELMRDPTTRTDATGEYIELFNPTGFAWSLEGCTIGDDGVDLHLIGALDVGPEEVVVLARSADPGFTPDYVYDRVVLANSGADEVVLRCGDVEVASVRYDDSWGFEVGRSLELGVSLWDEDENDDASAWCSSTDGDGDRGTPGWVGACAEIL